MTKFILGISAYYHDSAAAILVNGELIAAAQEERFTRIKHDKCFPLQAIKYCLAEAKITIAEVDLVVYYEKPLLKFERLLETYISYAPKGFFSFLKAMPMWLKEKLFLKQMIREQLSSLPNATQETAKLLFTEHHESHAASAYFPSPYSEAAILCLDGVGEWATTSGWYGEGNSLKKLWQLEFPHSLGLLYSAFTYYAGFKLNSGEYKLMGLSPYGEPKYVDTIKQHLIDIKDDGSFQLDMSYFDYPSGLKMTSNKFHRLFNGAPRKPESDITQKEMDLAKSIQVVTEEIVLKLAATIHQQTQAKYLCLAGGVALNCVANGKLLRDGPFKDIWVQPAAGDAGGCVGAVFSAWHQYLQQPRPARQTDQMKGSYLGPKYSEQKIASTLDALQASYEVLTDKALVTELSTLIAAGNVVGLFQGRMEFGPRALGNRSIIGDPRNADMQSQMNLKIKYRESFRPFAPSIKYDRVQDWFQLERASPYMLMVAQIKAEKLLAQQQTEKATGLALLNRKRSDIPAVTHVDNSARVQTVTPDTNPFYYRLLTQFETDQGCPLLINTSFNIRGEPIVCTPEDAYRCFMGTEMDILVLENHLLRKKSQPDWDNKNVWQLNRKMD